MSAVTVSLPEYHHRANGKEAFSSRSWIPTCAAEPSCGFLQKRPQVDYLTVCGQRIVDPIGSETQRDCDSQTICSAVKPSDGCPDRVGYRVSLKGAW